MKWNNGKNCWFLYRNENSDAQIKYFANLIDSFYLIKTLAGSAGPSTILKVSDGGKGGSPVRAAAVTRQMIERMVKS